MKRQNLMNRQNQMVGSWRPSLEDSMTTHAMLSNRTKLEGCFYFMQLHLIVDVKGRSTLCSQNMWQKKDNIIYIKVKRKHNIAATIIYIPGIPRYLCFKFIIHLLVLSVVSKNLWHAIIQKASK